MSRLLSHRSLSTWVLALSLMLTTALALAVVRMTSPTGTPMTNQTVTISIPGGDPQQAESDDDGILFWLTNGSRGAQIGSLPPGTQISGGFGFTNVATGGMSTTTKVLLTALALGGGAALANSSDSSNNNTGGTSASSSSGDSSSTSSGDSSSTSSGDSSSTSSGDSSSTSSGDSSSTSSGGTSASSSGGTSASSSSGGAMNPGELSIGSVRVDLPNHDSSSTPCEEPSDQVTFTNTGEESITVMLSSDQPFITADGETETSFNLGPGESKMVTVAFNCNGGGFVFDEENSAIVQAAPEDENGDPVEGGGSIDVTITVI